MPLNIKKRKSFKQSLLRLIAENAVIQLLNEISTSFERLSPLRLTFCDNTMIISEYSLYSTQLNTM